MSKFKAFIRQIHWKILLIRILVNGFALIITALVIPDVYFISKTLKDIILLSIGLGILNAVAKPVIMLLTGQLFFATYGLLVILVNALFLYLLQRFFPNTFAVNNFFWALIGGTVLGVISNALENLLGLAPPIVPDDNPELRKQIEAKQSASLVTFISKPQTMVPHDVDTQSISELTASKEVLNISKDPPKPGSDSQVINDNQPGIPQSNLPASDLPQTQGQETLSEDGNDPNLGGAA